MTLAQRLKPLQLQDVMLPKKADYFKGKIRHRINTMLTSRVDVQEACKSKQAKLFSPALENSAQCTGAGYIIFVGGHIQLLLLGNRWCMHSWIAQLLLVWGLDGAMHAFQLGVLCQEYWGKLGIIFAGCFESIHHRPDECSVQAGSLQHLPIMVVLHLVRGRP
ncbi:hypothetical protein B0H34DRAFT_674046 [Crassisporium funariophilum]|nr:hypothetical protein B0H34DRAFT_674046 [Crassisporium funariophilum]